MRPPVSTTDAPMHRPPDGGPAAAAALAAAVPAAALVGSYPATAAALLGLSAGALGAHGVAARLRELAGDRSPRRVCVPGTQVCLAV